MRLDGLTLATTEPLRAVASLDDELRRWRVDTPKPGRRPGAHRCGAADPDGGPAGATRGSGNAMTRLLSLHAVLTIPGGTIALNVTDADLEGLGPERSAALLAGVQSTLDLLLDDVVATAVSHPSPSSEAPKWDTNGEPDGPGSADDRYSEHPAPEVAEVENADADAEQARSPGPHQQGTAAWALLEEVAEDGGRYEGTVSGLARLLNRGVSGLQLAAKRLAEDGLIVLEMANAKRVEAVLLTDAGWAHLGRDPQAAPEPAPPPGPAPAPEADEAPAPASTGTSPFREGTAGWAILTELADLGGTFQGSVPALGDHLGEGFGFRGIETTVRRLRLAELIELDKVNARRTRAVRLTAAGWALLGRDAPASEPGPGPDDAEPPPAAPSSVPVDARWDTGWAFMGRTDRADREAAPKGNVLDPVLGRDDKGRPLIDSVEVIEELTDEQLAAALGHAG